MFKGFNVAEEIAKRKTQAADARRRAAVEADERETATITADVMKEVRADEKAKAIAAGNAAMHEYRETQTFDAAVQCGPIRVDWTFGTTTDNAYRATLYNSLTVAISRLHLWYEDGAMLAKLRAMGKTPDAQVPAAHVAAMIRDDLRGLIARGLAQVSLEEQS